MNVSIRQVCKADALAWSRDEAGKTHPHFSPVGRNFAALPGQAHPLWPVVAPGFCQGKIHLLDLQITCLNRIASPEANFSLYRAAQMTLGISQVIPNPAPQML